MYTNQVPTPIRPEWYSLNNANRVICTLCSKHEHMFRGQQLNCMARKGKGGQLSHVLQDTCKSFENVVLVGEGKAQDYMVNTQRAKNHRGRSFF